MHSSKILEKYGCTPARLRQIFTAQVAPSTPAEVSMDHVEPPRQPKTDSEIRKRFENRIRSRIIDGIGNNLRTSRPNQAVDLAWDAPPVQRETIPLLLWAQGKIKIEGEGGLFNTLTKACGDATAKRLVEKSPTDATIKVNIPRITEITVDLGRSYVTRRHSAMNALWSNLWPLLKYDPRGTDDVAQLRADVLTQRVDIISDAYNYRHFFSQCRRQMLLYGYSVAFPRSAWDRKVAWRFKRTNTGEDGEDTESFITREGVDFVNPHPSRIIYDLSAPLANLNTDTGPQYVGYWDVVRYGTLLEPGAPYFNLNHVFVSDGWIELATQFGEFFFYYFDPKVISWPTAGADPTLDNDRKYKVGRYTSESTDQGILLTQMFEKINPKTEGIGEYDADVWIRLTVAGDCTVIGAEFMPSIPGAYGAINWNDDRFSNQSMMMSLLAYQDQASNIVSHMLMQLRSSLVQLWLIDKDSLEPEIRTAIERNASNRDWWVDPKMLIYSATKLKDLGILDPRMAFQIIQPQVQGALEGGFKALGQLLNLADRLLILSPNELGQPNPREVSAREVTDIATSVQSMYSFINEGPREQMAAVKELIYESLLCCASQNFRVPIEKRYSKAVIQKAGMAIPDDVQLNPTDDILPVKTPIMGNLRDLNYDYYFDSRDGAERVLNTQGAQVVMQLLQSMLGIPPLAQKMGIKNIYDAANIVIRMSGAPWNFQFELPAGADETMPQENPDPNAAMKPLAMQLQRIEQILMQVLHIPPSALGIVSPLPAGAGALPSAPAPGAGAAPPAGTPTLPAAPPGNPLGGPAALLQEPQQSG